MIALATAEGIIKVADALSKTGGETAANLRVAEKYIEEFGNLAKKNNTIIIPANMGDMEGMVATAMSVMGKTKSMSSKEKPEDFSIS